MTSHSVELTGLTQNTTYHYRVRSKDAAGNEAESGDREVTTLDEDVTAQMYVDDITMSISSRGRNKTAHATVTVVSDGSPVSGATVDGSWSGVVSGSVFGVTGTDGTIQLSSPTTRSSGTFTFTVDDINHEELEYDVNQNEETSDSI